VLEAVRVRGRNYPISHEALTDHKRQNKPDTRPWRVAFIKTYTWDKAEPYARESMLKLIDRLSALDDVEAATVDLPSEFDCSHDVHATIYNKTLSYYFQNEFRKSELVSPVMNDLIRKGKEITFAAYTAAIGTQDRLRAAMDAFMQDYDVLISLSTAGTAPLRNVEEAPDPSLIWTMLHLPVVAVPAFTTGDHLPFGFQACSRKYNDHMLLNFLDYLYSRDLIPKRMNPICGGQS